MTIWNRFGVNSWPTLVLIDANGQYVGRVSGEGNLRRARPGDRPARRDAQGQG